MKKQTSTIVVNTLVRTEGMCRGSKVESTAYILWGAELSVLVQKSRSTGPVLSFVLTSGIATSLVDIGMRSCRN